jgi:hypothetical protein
MIGNENDFGYGLKRMYDDLEVLTESLFARSQVDSEARFWFTVRYKDWMVEL